MSRWQRLRYLPSIPLGSDGRRVTASDEHKTLSRRAAREGIVLLKNDDSVLPLVKGTSLALFGKGCADYVKGGGGSGDVFISSCRNIIDGLEEREKEGVIRLFHPTIDFYRDYVTSEYAGGANPGLVKEPELDPAMVEEARSFTDTAVIVISRYSGENWDRIAEGAPIFSTEEGTKALLEMQAAVFEHGDFYLSDAERAMVDKVVSAFPRVIVLLNAGGVMDVSWIADDPRIQGAMHVFQGGMEGGPAVADILLGYDSPSGRLTDTYARRLEDYPSTDGFHESLDYVEYREDVYVGYRYFSTIPGAAEKVVYPFGYGLSYTSFCIGKTEGSNKDLDVIISVDVENKGGYAGLDVVEIYAVPPAGRIGKPKRVLCGFGKTARRRSLSGAGGAAALRRKERSGEDRRAAGSGHHRHHQFQHARRTEQRERFPLLQCEVERRPGMVAIAAEQRRRARLLHRPAIAAAMVALVFRQERQPAPFRTLPDEVQSGHFTQCVEDADQLSKLIHRFCSCIRPGGGASEPGAGQAAIRHNRSPAGRFYSICPLDSRRNLMWDRQWPVREKKRTFFLPEP